MFNLNDDWKSSEKQLDVRIRIGDMAVSLESTLENIMILKVMLKSISDSKPAGTGNLMVTSKKDLKMFLEKNNIEARQI